ncbi:MAG: hypothetical protein J3K34DRAFT_441875 [Monoraphidium minutum]|nr:MAG: hypothetical protein J3K34DRAFT_441875 [Monoraphidium minutum]
MIITHPLPTLIHQTPCPLEPDRKPRKSKARAHTTHAQHRDATMTYSLFRGSGAGLVASCRPTRGCRLVTRVSIARDPLETLLGAQKLQVLGRAQEDLLELCTDLANDEERRRCWEVYRFFTSKRADAQSGCVRELEHGGVRGHSCEELDKLERLVYDLMSTGRTGDLYRILKVESDMAKRAAAGDGGPLATHLTPEEEAHEAHVAHLRARADELFGALDATGDGVLDREEFLQGMNTLRDELGWDEAELGTVFGAIDCHGHVTREQFSDILVAEELRDPSADAELLRHLAHARPSWWSDCPPALDTL